MTQDIIDNNHDKNNNNNNSYTVYDCRSWNPKVDHSYINQGS